ncbi:MAG: DUF3298 domain-containing protein [Fimbriimonadia bacterium]|nr:DUF3298 domain-containing protein [Fimbriimonadia bacterium]
MKQHLTFFLIAATIAIGLGNAFAWLNSQSSRTVDPPRFGKFTNKKEGWWEAKVSYPIFPAAAPAGVVANREFHQRAKKSFDSFMNQPVKYLKQSGKPTGAYSLTVKPTISIHRESLIAGYLSQDEYSGGAHSNRFYHTVNVSIVDREARLLKLRDVMARGVPLKEIEQIVLTKLNAIKRQRGADPMTELQPSQLEQFVLTPTGITWIFEPYAVGAYAEGDYFVRVTYEELGDRVRRF